MGFTYSDARRIATQVEIDRKRNKTKQSCSIPGSGQRAAEERRGSDDSGSERQQRDSSGQSAHVPQQQQQKDVSSSQSGESNPSFELKPKASCQPNTKASIAAYHTGDEACMSSGVVDSSSLVNEKVVSPSIPTNHKSRKKRAKRKKKVLHHPNGNDILSSGATTNVEVRMVVGNEDAESRLRVRALQVRPGAPVPDDRPGLLHPGRRPAVL